MLYQNIEDIIPLLRAVSPGLSTTFQGQGAQRNSLRACFSVMYCCSVDALSNFLARRPDQDGQSEQPEALCRSVACAHFGLRNPCHALGLSRPFGNRRGRRCDAGPVMVRRLVRGAQDRLDGRGVAFADSAARLHRPRGPMRQHPPVAERTQCLGARKRARLLPHLVPRFGHGFARGQGRHDNCSARGRSWDGPSSRP